MNLTPEDKAFLRDYLQKGIVRETVDNVKGFFKKEIKSIQGKTSEDLKRMDISDNTKFKALADLADAHAEEFDRKNLTLEQKINRLGQRYAAASLFSDEDGIVIALAEDECSQDNVDDIELHPQHLHDAQYPYPAHSQRQESHQAHLDASQRQPQEDKDHEAADEADIVERVGQGLGQVVADILLPEDEAAGR